MVSVVTAANTVVIGKSPRNRKWEHSSWMVIKGVKINI